MTPSLEELTRSLSEYLTEKWSTRVDIGELSRIPGGASRETYRMTARYSSDDGDTERGLVVRRDPESSLIDTERALEYQSYAAIYPTEIPVPEPLFLENDPKWLGQPFSIMAEIAGCQTDVGNLNDAQREKIGHEKWTLLGKLARMDAQDLGFHEFMEVPEPADCASRELAYWEQVILNDEVHPQPVARAALRWLRRNLPPPAQKLSVVHGDYRSRNFLFRPDEGITGVLDWEMCHLGDPLEDLAWSLDPLWSWPDPSLPGMLLRRDKAISVWEAASGLGVDPQAFRWWQIFASLKALAIWISSAEVFINGEAKDAILAVAGWVMGERQTRILVDRLSPNSKHRYSEEFAEGLK
jgi:aminoglycoside phosphotransferase (APT) family kinase protein